MFSPGQRIRLIRGVRNAFAVRPVQNNTMIFRWTADIQNEAIGVGSYPGQIARIVITEPDHSPCPTRTAQTVSITPLPMSK
jgi:hypothetical protein